MSGAGRRRRAAGLAVLLVAAACDVGAPARVRAPADSAAGEVPITFARPNEAAILVPVHVDGRGPYLLVLDTGATLTCVDEGLAKELDLPTRRGSVGLGAGLGVTGRVRLVRIDSLRVGGARAADLTACVVDLSNLRAVDPQVRGLLGLNVLRAFRVTLDFRRDVVRLERP